MTGGLTAWGGDRIGDVLAAYRAMTESAPREAHRGGVREPGPSGSRDPSRAARQADGRNIPVPQRQCRRRPRPAWPARRPFLELVGERPYVEQQAMFDAGLPAGLAYHERSHHALRVSSAVGESVLLHLGGAPNELAEDDGAVGNRAAQ